MQVKFSPASKWSLRLVSEVGSKVQSQIPSQLVFCITDVVCLIVVVAPNVVVGPISVVDVAPIVVV